MQALKIISFSIFHQINFKMVLFSASCHEDSIGILEYKIEAWEGGQKIGQTNRQTDKPNYNIDLTSDYQVVHCLGQNNCNSGHFEWEFHDILVATSVNLLQPTKIEIRVQ